VAYTPPPSPYLPHPPPPARPVNPLAVPALLTGIVLPPLGAVLGHISLSQIKRREEEGHGTALAGTILGYVLTLTAIAVVVVLVLRPFGGDTSSSTASSSPSSSTTSSSTSSSSVTSSSTNQPPSGVLPPFRPPADLGTNCTYPAGPEPSAKPVTPPRSGRIPTDPAQVSASVTTSQGPIGLTLNNGQAPCTVNSFASLAQKGYFNDTQCHRLTSSSSLHVLQCGDPKGDGTGSPGYRFADEYPANQYPPDDPGLSEPVVYPRGTLAMANAGPNTNGSQFFLVYKDSQLPPKYTVFGTIDETGLATLDKIAAAGTADGSEDGKPASDVTITSARLD
jgi:peptidyl-prolyl cis-trans isomerase B (cyclophilin B)